MTHQLQALRAYTRHTTECLNGRCADCGGWPMVSCRESYEREKKGLLPLVRHSNGNDQHHAFRFSGCTCGLDTLLASLTSSAPAEAQEMRDGCRLNRAAYQSLVDDNIAWLRSMPRTLEREHIIAIVNQSVDDHYPEPSSAPAADGKEQEPDSAGICPDCGYEDNPMLAHFCRGKSPSTSSGVQPSEGKK
jgi:hypothetical protein